MRRDTYTSFTNHGLRNTLEHLPGTVKTPADLTSPAFAYNIDIDAWCNGDPATHHIIRLLTTFQRFDIQCLAESDRLAIPSRFLLRRRSL